MEFESFSSYATIVVAAILLVLERLSAWRRQPTPIRQRWFTNIGLMLLAALTVSIIFNEDAVSVAGAVEGGLLRHWSLPWWVELVAVFLLLDCWRYWEHRVYHEVPLFWRVHLVHHSDTALDITTAERHHPIEAILAVCTTLLLVFAFGISAQALSLYVAVATLSALLTHANINLPEGIDGYLRYWLVTPSVHSIHHSDDQPQTDSNYGTVLSVWDRLFGTYNDPGVAQVRRFGLREFHLEEDRALGPVLLQPFEYRPGMDYPDRDAVVAGFPVSPAIALSADWQRALILLAAGLGLALLALWPTVSSLTGVWSHSDPYQYAWMVSPMFLYQVGWHYRDEILALSPRQYLPGLAVILVATLLWCAAFVVDIQLGQHLALVLVFQGLILSAVGPQIFFRYLPLMLLLLFMVPSGDLLQPLLRELTVKWIEWLALLMQAPVRVDGFMVYVGEHRYVVVDACSGLTFVTLGAFLGYSMGLLMYRSLPRILALAAIGAVLGVLSNAIRVWLIVGIDWLRGTQMDMDAHMDLQWLALLGGLAALFWYTSKLSMSVEGEQESTRPDVLEVGGGGVRLAPVMAGLLVAVILLPVQASFARSGRVAKDHFPEIVSSYTTSEQVVSAEGGERALVIKLDNESHLILSEPVGIDGRPEVSRFHPPDTSTWRHAGADIVEACNDEGCVEFLHDTWRRKGANDARHSLYAYYVGEMLTASKLQHRIASGLNRLAGSGKPAGMVGFSLRGELPADEVLAGEIFGLQAYLGATIE